MALGGARELPEVLAGIRMSLPRAPGGPGMPSFEEVLFYRAGKCSGHPNSVFLAEMLALEWALGVLLARFVGGAL